MSPATRTLMAMMTDKERKMATRLEGKIVENSAAFDE